MHLMHFKYIFIKINKLLNAWHFQFTVNMIHGCNSDFQLHFVNICYADLLFVHFVCREYTFEHIPKFTSKLYTLLITYFKTYWPFNNLQQLKYPVYINHLQIFYTSISKQNLESANYYQLYMIANVRDWFANFRTDMCSLNLYHILSRTVLLK